MVLENELEISGLDRREFSLLRSDGMGRVQGGTAVDMLSTRSVPVFGTCGGDGVGSPGADQEALVLEISLLRTEGLCGQERREGK